MFLQDVRRDWSLIRSSTPRLSSIWGEHMKRSCDRGEKASEKCFWSGHLQRQLARLDDRVVRDVFGRLANEEVQEVRKRDFIQREALTDDFSEYEDEARHDENVVLVDDWV